MVKSEGIASSLKARLGDNKHIPPTSGWQFRNRDTKKFENDPRVKCTTMAPSTPCNVTVSLSGLAKETEGRCEGEYQETGLFSVGKKVTDNLVRSFAQLFVGVQA